MADGLNALFPAASRIVAAVMARGARAHLGEDWRVLPAGFHLARARRHLDLLAVGDVSGVAPRTRCLPALDGAGTPCSGWRRITAWLACWMISIR